MEKTVKELMIEKEQFNKEIDEEIRLTALEDTRRKIEERDRRRREKQELEDKGWLGRVFYESPVEEIQEKVEEEVSVENQIQIVKEVKEIVNDKLEELQPGKVQCPECRDFFTKGGAFAKHYQSHFNGNGDIS